MSEKPTTHPEEKLESLYHDETLLRERAVLEGVRAANKRALHVTWAGIVLLGISLGVASLALIISHWRGDAAPDWATATMAAVTTAAVAYLFKNASDGASP